MKVVGIHHDVSPLGPVVAATPHFTNLPYHKAGPNNTITRNQQPF